MRINSMQRTALRAAADAERLGGADGRMTFLVAFLMVLGSLIAVGNIAGSIRAYLQRRRRAGDAFSSVPLVSLFCSGVTWLVSGDRFVPWVFLPAILDPATWSLIALPVFLASLAGS